MQALGENNPISMSNTLDSTEISGTLPKIILWQSYPAADVATYNDLTQRQ